MSGERIGFLGLGTMGAAMAANLARAGFAVTAWNRSPGRAPGARPISASTGQRHPADVAARQSTPIVICVSDTPDVEAILFGADGVADGARTGLLVIDCSTISPSATRDFAARLARAAASTSSMRPCPAAARAPRRRRSRSSAAARRRTSSAPGRSSRRWARRSPTSVRAAPGQAVKAVNQVILAGTYLGVAEGIVLAMKAGLDVEQVVEALGGGAAQSWVLANRSGRMIANDYPLGFKVALHRKDLGIALELAREMGADLPVAELAAELRDGARRRRPRRRRHVGPRPDHPRPIGPARLTVAGRSRRRVRRPRSTAADPHESIGSPSLPS